MTERKIDDQENDTYYEQIAKIAEDMADTPNLSNNLKEIIENEYLTPDRNEKLE